MHVNKNIVMIFLLEKFFGVGHIRPEPPCGILKFGIVEHLLSNPPCPLFTSANPLRRIGKGAKRGVPLIRIWLSKQYSESDT